MTRILVFAVEVENDQDVPEVGEYFDVENSTWQWMDVRFAGTMDSDNNNDDANKLIQRIV